MPLVSLKIIILLKKNWKSNNYKIPYNISFFSNNKPILGDFGNLSIALLKKL